MKINFPSFLAGLMILSGLMLSACKSAADHAVMQRMACCSDQMCVQQQHNGAVQ